MRLVGRLVTLILLLLLVIVAAKNSQMTTLELLFGYAVALPLIVLIVSFFVVGVVCGLLMATRYLFTLRHQANHPIKAATNDPAHNTAVPHSVYTEDLSDK
ncbi:MAG: LapA family protein [Neisseriales bacterium]|nr:MAG: LapA family protein [Neisseriales bacterium]